MPKFNLSLIKNMDKNTMLIGIAVVAIIITGILVLSDKGFDLSFSGLGLGISNQQIADKSIEYVNKNLLQGNTASIISVSEESGLVKIKTKIDANEFDLYATKDGKLLFPQVFNMAGTGATDASQNTGNGSNTQGKTAAEVLASITKVDKPLIEAFIVSRCPFGLQMQRMINEAIKGIPSLAQYVKVRYIGSVSGSTITSMHGDAEAQENLRQICIREEQANKYWAYAACQMKTGDTAGCETSTGIDSKKLSSCISDTSRGVAYAKEDFDLAAKYNASGSPTMVINEAQIEEFDKDNAPVFGGRTADAAKTMVCDASNTQPSFCSTKLSTDQAATSFSAIYADTSANSGNSGATGAGCAPAQ